MSDVVDRKNGYIIQSHLDTGKNTFKSHRRLKFKGLKSVNNPTSIHGIYPYRGKISPVDATQIISQLPNSGVLLDPFCGSGTIIYEAQKWGLEAIGVDNNPLAVVLAKAKTEGINVDTTLRHVREIIDRAKGISDFSRMPERIAKYFHNSTAEQIMRIYKFIDEMSFYDKAAYYGAICLAARGCNHYKWSSTSVGKIITPLRKIDFYEKFYHKVKKHIPPINVGIKPAKIFQHDSRKLSEIIPANSIDFVYTSPPYFNALDYTSYYTRIIYAIESKNRDEIRKGLIQKFSTYEKDMKIVIDEIDKVTKKDALIIFVVGDKKFDDKIINGGFFFKNLSDWEPTYIVERKYTGTASQIWDSINKTDRKEQIVVWDKAQR